MSSPIARGWLVAGGGFVAGALAVALAFVAREQADERSREARSSASSAAITRAEWEALVAAVARLEAAAAPELASPDTRTALDAALSAESQRSPRSPQSIAELTASVRELQQSVAGLRELAGAATNAPLETLSLHELSQRRLPTDWRAIDALIELCDRGDEGEKAALDEVRFASQSEILRRFGRPTSIDFGAGSMSWTYSREVQGEDGPRTRGLELGFSQGLLVWVARR